MGAWGSQAYENDTAADFCDKYLSTTPLPQLIKKGLMSSNYDEIRLACWFLRHIGINYVYPTCELKTDIEEAIAKIKNILRDDEWLQTWKDINIVVKDLLSALAELESRVQNEQ